MNAITRYLQNELPRINAFLEAETAKLDPVVRPAVKHVLSAGGKRLRPVLTILSARALGCEADLYPLACSLELLHSATLLHDDIVDDAALRRGKTAAHLEFGKAGTILAGDVLLALANRLVAEYGLPRLTVVLSEAILRTATGEVMEIANVRNADLTEPAYYEIITGKTAYLFQGACECGAILSGRGEAMERAAHDFGLNLGIAFQLVDDALDYVSPSSVTGKPSGGDLREGKMTLPLLFYLRDLDQTARAKLTASFAAGDMTQDEAERIANDVAERGFAEQTRDVARTFAAKAEQALTSFPDSPEKDILQASLGGVLSRNK